MANLAHFVAFSISRFLSWSQMGKAVSGEAASCAVDAKVGVLEEETAISLGLMDLAGASS